MAEPYDLLLNKNDVTVFDNLYMKIVKKYFY